MFMRSRSCVRCVVLGIPTISPQKKNKYLRCFVRPILFRFGIWLPCIVQLAFFTPRSISFDVFKAFTKAPW